MKSNKKNFVGNVIKISGTKTISVSVERSVRDARYNKNIKKTSKFLVHDEKGMCKVGDKVSFVECRPLSKRKKFFVVEILNNLNSLYDTARV